MKKSLSRERANESSDMAKSFNAACASQTKDLCASERESIGVHVEHAATNDGQYGESNREDDMNARTHDESESLSDIDDLEIDLYLHNEEERHYKKIIWEKLNWGYLMDQVTKEAAAKEGLQATRALGSSTSASVAKSQKGKKQRRTQEAKSPGSAQFDPKATQALRKKRLSSKVNFEMVEKLFDEPAALENPKKARYEPCSDNHDNIESELENKNRGDELESVDKFEEDLDDMGGLYENALYDDNMHEGYDYEEDDYSYE